MLVPATQSTGTRSSSRTRSTPTWARPSAPPPERTSATRGRAAAGSGAGSEPAAAAVGPSASRASSAPDRANDLIAPLDRSRSRADATPVGGWRAPAAAFSACGARRARRADGAGGRLGADQAHLDAIAVGRADVEGPALRAQDLELVDALDPDLGAIAADLDVGAVAEQEGDDVVAQDLHLGAAAVDAPANAVGGDPEAPLAGLDADGRGLVLERDRDRDRRGLGGGDGGRRCGRRGGRGDRGALGGDRRGRLRRRFRLALRCRGLDLHDLVAEAVLLDARLAAAAGRVLPLEGVVEAGDLDLADPLGAHRQAGAADVDPLAGAGEPDLGRRAVDLDRRVAPAVVGDRAPGALEQHLGVGRGRDDERQAGEREPSRETAGSVHSSLPVRPDHAPPSGGSHSGPGARAVESMSPRVPESGRRRKGASHGDGPRRPASPPGASGRRRPTPAVSLPPSRTSARYRRSRSRRRRSGRRR